MRIGELARLSGLAPSKIRFYESVGVLREVERHPNGYRVYPPEALVTLELVVMAQRSGFSLDEIRKLLPSEPGHWQHDALMTVLEEKVAHIEALQARLAWSKSHLRQLMNTLKARPDNIDCIANQKRVLSQFLGADGADQVNHNALTEQRATPPL
ncbi:MAG: MerR family transcriptional regulator [Candidatus Eremiobacteraeota bacterium]|nr:MerR family transcriptional regulator [Candidatus Eremiobacteraeota bacterium]MCW5866193.1 MerR family transcriptional regulator [Candidatus Eremiobacteraeota bacterium]